MQDDRVALSDISKSILYSPIQENNSGTQMQSRRELIAPVENADKAFSLFENPI
jgi:hypothetical protein